MAVKGQCGSSLWWGNYSNTWLLVLILYYNFKDVTFGGNQVFLKKRVYEISLCYFFELHVNLQLSHDKKFNENNYKRIGRKYSILFSWIYDRESLWNKTFDIEAVKEDINKFNHIKKHHKQNGKQPRKMFSASYSVHIINIQNMCFQLIWKSTQGRRK